MILAGDIGGTKTNLGLFDVQQGRLNRVAEKRYPSREHHGLEEIVADFVVVTGVKATRPSLPTERTPWRPAASSTRAATGTRCAGVSPASMP